MLKLDTSKEGKIKRYIEVYDRLRADHYLRYGLLGTIKDYCLKHNLNPHTVYAGFKRVKLIIILFL